MIRFLIPRRWRDRGRLLFHYHDGRRRRSIDPLEAWQSLERHPSYRHSRDFPLAMAGDEEKQSAGVAAVCDAFGVEPHSDQAGRGMTISERLGLLVAFDEYATGLREGLGLAAVGRDAPAATFEDVAAAPAAMQQTEAELQQTGAEMQQGAE